MFRLIFIPMSMCLLDFFLFLCHLQTILDSQSFGENIDSSSKSTLCQCPVAPFFSLLVLRLQSVLHSHLFINSSHTPSFHIAQSIIQSTITMHTTLETPICPLNSLVDYRTLLIFLTIKITSLNTDILEISDLGRVVKNPTSI